MQFLSSRSKNIISPFSSASNLFSLAISTDGAEVATRAYSQHNSYYRSHNDGMAGTFVWGMAAVVATAGISLLGISSSSLSQTLCESTTVGTSPEEDPEAEPEIDPYDNLPEEDEPTHCSICMTYRQVGSNTTNIDQKYQLNGPRDLTFSSKSVFVFISFL